MSGITPSGRKRDGPIEYSVVELPKQPLAIEALLNVLGQDRWEVLSVDKDQAILMRRSS